MKENRPRQISRLKHLVWLVVAASLAAAAPARAAWPTPGLFASEMLGQASYGTIHGRLVWGGDNVPPAQVLVAKGKATKDPEVCARDQAIPSSELVVDPKTKGVAGGIAYLVRPSGSNPEALREMLARNPKVLLDQVNCAFVPHVLAFHQDQTLLIKSSDPINHNVRCTGIANAGFNDIVGPKGQMEKKLVADRFAMIVACDIHSWMKAHLMVFDHPFFTTTGADGSFEIKGVPAGRQSLVVWHETVGYVTPGRGQGMPVEVVAGAANDVPEIKLDPGKVKLTEVPLAQ